MSVPFPGFAARRSRRTHPRIRLRLNQLEHRLVPAAFVVTNAGDSGPGSLRQAVLDANASAGADSVSFDPVAFAFPQTVTLTTGFLSVTGATTITGPGASKLTLSGNDASALLAVNGANVNVSGLTLARAKSAGSAAISASGTIGALALTDCVVTQNYSSGTIAVGAVRSTVPLTLTNCVVSNNFASGTNAVAGVNANANLSITNCVVRDNFAFGTGAVAGVSGGTVNAVACTFSGNVARGTYASGGAYAAAGTFGGCVFTANVATATDAVGGLRTFGGALSLNGCQFTGNVASGTVVAGGLKCKNDSLKISDCVVADNIASGTSAVGGLASSAGAFTLLRSTIANNQANSSAGGISLVGQVNGSVHIDDSTVSGNIGGFGGGILVSGSPAIVRLRNSTVSGNTSRTHGGGVYLTSLGIGLTLQNCTITANIASVGGGVAVVGKTSVPLVDVCESSIVQGNFAPTSANYSTPFKVAAKNCAFGTTAGIATLIDQGGNLVGADLKLAPLANNGGPTRTHALLPGSAAADAGSNPAGLAGDQRGPAFPRVSGPAPDIGAFELQRPPTVVAVTVNDGSAQRSRVTSVRVTFSEPVSLVGGTAAFQLQRTGPGAPIGNVNLNAVQSGNAVTLTFATGGAAGVDPGGSLADGTYVLTVFGSKVVGAGGLLDGDGNGTPGGDYVTPTAGVGAMFRLFGDSDGDRDVDAVDLAAFRLEFGSASAVFDFDGDGDADAADFGQFRLRFGESV